MMKKLTIRCTTLDLVEVDPICGMESDFIRMKLKDNNGCDGGRPLSLPIPAHTLVMVLYYCKKRGKIKLSHYQGDDDDENLSAQQLKEFDTKFVNYIRLYPDSSVFLNIFDAALKLRVKHLYDLILDDVASICDKLSAKKLEKTIQVGRIYGPKDITSFNWAYSINATHVKLDTPI
uniref:uncharacterized protein LOC122600443 n=1 Tax=Erigeron canadensis TaxID=72917 RepID=UPI001CB90B41|nr:uncharacterized protein LOC122600443 [Erigeron canadensis]